jgi:HEAT repeat protein
MKSRWKIGLTLGVAGLIAAGWIVLGHSREPRYLGRSVSYWFREYYLDATVPGHVDGDHTYGSEALQAMGTNALPYLVRQALSTRRDTALRTNIYNLLAKLPKSWHLPQFISYEDIRDYAVGAIGEINPPASAILPLVQKALDSKNPQQHRQALEILSDVETGEELLVPCFARALHFPDEESRDLALEFFQDTGAPTGAAVPDLIDFLKHSDSTNRVARQKAADALGKLGSEAAPAVPILKEMFVGEKIWGWRIGLATALCRIDGRQTNALAFIVDGLGAADASEPEIFRYRGHRVFQEPAELNFYNPVTYSVEQLEVIGTNAAPAIPALIQALDGTNVLVWITAGPALKSMGAPRELYLPKLEDKLNLVNDGPRASLALFLMDNEPGNQAAQAALIDLIRRGSPYGRVALDAWDTSDGTSKPFRPPKEAIPILQEALKSGNASWRKAAAETLKRIEAQEKRK